MQVELATIGEEQSQAGFRDGSRITEGSSYREAGARACSFTLGLLRKSRESLAVDTTFASGVALSCCCSREGTYCKLVLLQASEVMKTQIRGPQP